MFDDDGRLPEGGVLLHIGPHKTGTTAIQGALKLARPQMARHGVVYAGNVRQHSKAALALTGREGLIGDRPARPADWQRLVDDVHAAAGKRVVISSEFFCDAESDTIREIVDGLGGEPVHVLITLRPLGKILPSAWQQYVRNGFRGGYRPWLDRVIKQGSREATPSFWHRHHHDELVERWAAVVGPERVLVLVVDETKPDGILRSFEQIAGLPDGLLQLERRTNRSLTGAETQLIRAMNVKYVENNWSPKVYDRVFRWGAIEQMQRRKPDPDEPGIKTPPWAVDRANEIAAAAAEQIATMGVRVVGDLSSLSTVKFRAGAVPIEQVMLSPAAAAEAVTGVMVASGVLDVLDAAAEPPARPIETYSSKELARIVAGRIRSRLHR